MHFSPTNLAFALPIECQNKFFRGTGGSALHLSSIDILNLVNATQSLSHRIPRFMTMRSHSQCEIIVPEPVEIEPERWCVQQSLQLWVASALPNEIDKRVVAAKILTEAFLRQTKNLRLNGFGLTSLPSCLDKFSMVLCLEIRSNALLNLPLLPPNLIELKAGSNLLKTIPELPVNLQKLSVYRNAITELPDLPVTLRELNVYENKLHELPALPDALECLNAYGNQLSHCPRIPQSARMVNLSNNMFDSYPESQYPLMNTITNCAKLIRQWQLQY